MVLQIGALRSGRDADVQADIAAVVEVAHAAGAIVKVIFENAYLVRRREDPRLPPHRGRRRRLRQDLHRFRAERRDPRGPALMRAHTSPPTQVKAAGGVRTLDALLAVMALGVTRVGATATEPSSRTSGSGRPTSRHPGRGRSREPAPRPPRTAATDGRAVERRRQPAGGEATLDGHRGSGLGHQRTERRPWAGSTRREEEAFMDKPRRIARPRSAWRFSRSSTAACSSSGRARHRRPRHRPAPRPRHRPAPRPGRRVARLIHDRRLQPGLRRQRLARGDDLLRQGAGASPSGEVTNVDGSPSRRRTRAASSPTSAT